MREIFDAAAQRVPIYAWADEVEPGALEQALHLASLPFAYHHVVLLPDGHTGYGMPVGGVLAARGAVVPNAVGVDIGCFTGDTLVPMIDGRAYRIDQLAARSERGEELYVWACTPSGKVVAARATGQRTRAGAALVQIVLDNDEVIRCTPDHEFMLRDGTYRQARHLAPGTSLMPLYPSRASGGYALVQQNCSGRWQHGYNHTVVAVQPLVEREDVYCLTVPELHNFALAAGVFVHNCGMIARRTSLRVERVQAARPGQGTVLEAALGNIMRAVPVGLPPGGSHKTAQAWDPPAESSALVARAPAPLLRAWERSALQLGTLGSGNHFIEVQADAEGRVWLMLHSGSRALGKAVCDHYNGEAVQRNARERSPVPKAWQLAHLRTDDALGRQYLQWMHLCLAYAEQNRALMLERVTAALESAAGAFAVEATIQTHHNYAAPERHYGQEVWVHRKGACRARDGERVIIPGSMETGSYIGRGRGHPASFESCSHGAGRRMSRGAARRARTVQDMVEALRRKGIALATPKVEGVLDEAGHAYKDVAAVVAQEADLVQPVVELRPLGVVKG